MIKLLIFDLWGTIIENGVYSPIKQVKNILRINMPFEEYVVRFEKVLMLNNYSDLYEGFKLVCKEFNIRDNPYILNKLVGIWNKNWLLAKPYNNALETVQTLKEKYKTVLIVNADKSINSLIEKYSLEKYFDKIYLSYQTKFLKVNPESFKLIIKDFNVKPEECVMIGDSIDSDMKTPSALGMKTVLVDFKERREYPLKIRTVKELPELIKNMN
jgi:HAD superfamily hydrolase (TIGR01509 family)